MDTNTIEKYVCSIYLWTLLLFTIIYHTYVILADVSDIFLFFEILVNVRNNPIQTDPYEEPRDSRPESAYKEVWAPSKDSGTFLDPCTLLLGQIDAWLRLVTYKYILYKVQTLDWFIVLWAYFYLKDWFRHQSEIPSALRRALFLIYFVALNYICTCYHVI